MSLPIAGFGGSGSSVVAGVGVGGGGGGGGGVVGVVTKCKYQHDRKEGGNFVALAGGGEIDNDDVEDVGEFTKLSMGFRFKICCMSSSR